MGDDYEVGYGKPPAKTKFQKGKSGNPSGRPKRRNPPNEPLDFQKALIAELKSLMTINEAGKKKKVSKLEAFMKTFVARSFHDKAMMKYLFNWIVKLPKEAFVDETSTRSRLPSPRWTYGRKSNRTSPRGQRIRAKQQTSEGD